LVISFSSSGITTFQSRSFMDWQKSGGKNLFPGTLTPEGFVVSKIVTKNAFVLTV
jgi:hypothetical protein